MTRQASKARAREHDSTASVYQRTAVLVVPMHADGRSDRFSYELEELVRLAVGEINFVWRGPATGVLEGNLGFTPEPSTVYISSVRGSFRTAWRSLRAVAAVLPEHFVHAQASVLINPDRVLRAQLGRHHRRLGFALSEPARPGALLWVVPSKACVSQLRAQFGLPNLRTVPNA